MRPLRPGRVGETCGVRGGAGQDRDALVLTISPQPGEVHASITGLCM